MPNQQPHLARANTILRELDAVYPGFTPPEGKFQIRWSEDMTALVPRYEFKANLEIGPVMEYRCACGTDVVIHQPSCGGMTIAKVKLHRVSMFGADGEYPTYRNVWVLCRWNPPPIKADWIDQMGTDEDYPAQGRYLPISKGPYLVVVPKKATAEDLPDCARLMVHMMTEQMRNMQEFRAQAKEKAEMLRMPIEDAKGNVIREPHKDAPFWRIKDRVKEKMRSFNPTGTVGYTKTLEKEG